MRFEHLIELNSPATSVQTVVPAFTPEQVWQGLLARVCEPGRFPNGPDSCRLEGVQPRVWAHAALARTVCFGAHEFHDQVEFSPERKVVFTPQPHGDTTPVRLTLSVEEPAPGWMVLRFVYEALGPLSDEEAYYTEFRHNAWLHHDRDMVRTWRQWLSDGQL